MLPSALFSVWLSGVYQGSPGHQQKLDGPSDNHYYFTYSLRTVFQGTVPSISYSSYRAIPL